MSLLEKNWLKWNWTVIFLIKYSVDEDTYLFSTGSIDHAETELLNFSTWKWKTSLPYLNNKEVYLFATLFYRDAFYVVGGRTKAKILSEVAIFNPVKEKWSLIGNLRSQRFGHKIDVIDDKLIIIGGSKDFEHCDLTTKFNCSMFVNAKFDIDDIPIMYGSFPSQCRTGNADTHSQLNYHKLQC